jgi:DNA-directed RNA polymerase specialized sigma54-like protein
MASPRSELRWPRDARVGDLELSLGLARRPSAGELEPAEELTTMLHRPAQAPLIVPSAYSQLLRSEGLKRLTEQMLTLVARRRGESLETRRDAESSLRGTRARRSLERLPAPGDSLAEHLSGQLRIGWRDPRLAALGHWIIWNLDPDGYLREDIGELAAVAGASVAELERALTIVQSLEPTGVGARCLCECLLLQLRARPAPDPVAMWLVDGHLPALAAGRRDDVARSLGLPLDRVERALAEIRRLEPRPGRAFDTLPIPVSRPWTASHRSPADGPRSLPRSSRRVATPRRLATPENGHEAARRPGSRTVVASVRPR